VSGPVTVGDLIGQTRRYLQGTARGALNVLGAAMTDTTGTMVTFLYDLGQSVVKQSYICADDEIMYVLDVQPSAKTATVIRAQLGTTATTHANGTVVECQARFPKPFIRDALQDDIESWPDTVYAQAAVTLSVPSNSYSVDATPIPSNFISILEVTRKPTTTATASIDPLKTSYPQIGYRYERNLDTANFASGTAFFLDRADTGGYTIRVVYSLPFVTATFDDSVNLVSTVLLEATMTDIPPLGAAARLLSGREVLRSQLEAQGEARNANEIRVGETLRSATQLRAMRDQRLSEESTRLLGRFGWRRTA
jgi:hypothetical protein